MTDPLDVVLDAFVYVPVGLAVSARELLPELAARGRERVASARVVGQFAVQQGPAQAVKLFERMQGGATTTPTARTSDAPGATATATRTSGPGAGDLAVPGYDSLSASQVLPRLAGLEPDELEAVRAYEAAHRGRKTILGRIAHLQER